MADAAEAVEPDAYADVAADTTTPDQIVIQIKVYVPTSATTCSTTDTRRRPNR